MNGPADSPVSHAHDVENWACRLADRLPSADVRHLARAAAGGEPGVRQLRATTASPILRDACEQLLRRLRHAESAYLSGLLAGAACAVERARHNQSVSVVWTGPESGVSSSRLTAAAVIELINAARSAVLLVSYATQTEPQISAALSAAVARNVAVTLLAERHADNPSYSSVATPFPGLGALACTGPRRHGRLARHCTQRSSWWTTRSRSSAVRTSPAERWNPTSNAASSSAADRNPVPSTTTSPAYMRLDFYTNCDRESLPQRCGRRPSRRRPARFGP